MFEYYLKKITKIGKDVDVNILARSTTGLTGADIQNIVNTAAVRYFLFSFIFIYFYFLFCIFCFLFLFCFLFFYFIYFFDRAASKSSFVNMDLLRDAQDDTLIGPERRSVVMQQKEKEMTAYHEAGRKKKKKKIFLILIVFRRVG